MSAPAPGLVSVVMVGFNCRKLIDVVMPTLLDQDYAPIEIIVADNGSTDGTCDHCRCAYPSVRLLPLGGNRGFSAAFNEGVRQSSGTFILSLNFDVVLERTFVGRLVAALQEHADVGWAAGAMRRLTWEGVQDAIDCNGHYLLSSRYCYGYDPDRPSAEEYRQGCEVFGASACAALYRREMLGALALDGEILDEDLFAYFEDVDLDWRAQRAGYRCRFVPDARGAHMRGGTGAGSVPGVAAMLVANRLLVMLKNDRLRDVLRDASPIVRRTIVDFGLLWRRGRTVPVRAVGRFLRLMPRMAVKRLKLKRRDVGGPSPVRRFRLPTRFLG